MQSNNLNFKTQEQTFLFFADPVHLVKHKLQAAHEKYTHGHKLIIFRCLLL
jgi:hypothetical protein